MTLLVFLSGRRETDGQAGPTGVYQGPFTRWFCHEEMAAARDEGLHIIGVMQIRWIRGSVSDLGLERAAVFCAAIANGGCSFMITAGPWGAPPGGSRG